MWYIFGSKYFVHIPCDKRRKLDVTASEMIFLGYESNSKAFRCYNNVSKRVVISRDVRFTDITTNSIDKEVSLDFNKQNNCKLDPLLIEEENSHAIKINETAINNVDVSSNYNLNKIDQNNLESGEPSLRVSSRENKGKAPKD